jgi:DNA-binding response OmpR family regulator
MPGRNRRVLVIDGDITVGIALDPYLREHGCEVRTAKTAADGQTEALNSPPSLILMAATLPDSTGVHLFRELRAHTRLAHTPIMFIVGYGESAQQNELLKAGADDVILKPFDSQILTLRIRNAIQRSERDGIVHPRSGLPTGQWLTERIRALADEYGWYKIDFAIESFEAFVEQYGFMSGEEVINFTVGLITEVVQQHGTPEDFIGQRDDTHFSIITRLDNGIAMRDSLEQRFNTEVGAFYSFMERDQGFVEVNDGTGGTERKPLMSARIKVQEGEPE